MFGKKDITVGEDAIEMPINPATSKSFGVAFIKMANEEQARYGASIFDGFPLAKKNLATCLMPDYEKIMQTEETFEMP